ncbi:MAG: Ig-like domain-containing protein [Longimicrobiales bacterium]
MRPTDSALGRKNVLRTVAAVLAFGWVALLGCEGDTLYEQDILPGAGPQVAIVSPAQGDQATAGRPVAVRVAAQDADGVAELELVFRGVATGTFRFAFVPPVTSVVVDTVIALPSGTVGTLELRAAARSGRGVLGRSATVVVPVQLSDSISPGVALAVVVPPRMELTDSIRATITASDNAGGTGLTRVGLTVLVTRPQTTDTAVFERVFDLGAPQTGTVTREVVFAAPFADPQNLPRPMNLSFHAFAIDSTGNCAATVANAGAQRLTCAQFRNSTVARAVSPSIPTTVVFGRSVILPFGASIQDAAPDVPRERLYLSNLTASRLEVLNLRSLTFGQSVLVGSQPWGVHINRTGDSLIVANSGGTSLSYVTLAGTPTEIVSARVQTPNVNLFEVKFHNDALFSQRYNINFIDFSDRPQFLAQDAFGRILYSTLPTAAAGLGTMRVADRQPGWAQAEVRLLLGRNVTEPDSFTVSVINVDSMRVFTSPFTDLIEIYDHVNGSPSTVIRSGIKTLQAALDSLDNDPDSDIIWIAGRFDRTLIGLGNPTFVAASGNRQRVVFGESGVGNGRIFMWEAPLSEISNEITVADLVGNTAEFIVGIDLNQDGTLNTARGRGAAFYFKQDLRLQGHFAAGSAGGGSGAAVHPDHPSYVTQPPSGPNTLAYVAVGRSVKIVDTVHFVERGDLQIRDNIVGPLKVSRPLPSDNAGCSGANCIVARLYGITDAGAVVVMEVRGRDIR